MSIETEKIILRAILSVYILIFILTGVYSVLSLSVNGSGRNLIGNESESLKTGWQTEPEGKSISLPAYYLSPNEFPLTIKRTLPDKGKDSWIIMIRSNHQFVDVKLNGNLVFSYHSYGSAASPNKFGGYLPAQWFTVYPGMDWQGKELSITYTPDLKGYKCALGEVFIGDRTSVIFQAMKRELIFILVISILLGTGILLIVFRFILHRNGEQRTGFTFISVFTILFGIFFFCRLECNQIIISDLSFTENLGVLCLFMIPLPLTISMDRISEDRYFKEALFTGGLQAAILIPVFIIFLTKGGRALIKIQSLAGLLFLLSMAYTLYVHIRSLREDREYHNRIRWYTCLSIAMYACAIFDSHFYYSHHHLLPFLPGTWSALGCAIMDIGIIIWAASKYRSILDRINTVEAESKARNEFYSGVSHKIRTPINGILGMNEMILRESVDPQITSYAVDIQKSGELLMEVVDEILRFSGCDDDRSEDAEAAESRQNASEKKETHPDIFGKFTAPKASVLVVDDTDVNRRLLEHMLKRTQIKLSCVKSGMECLEKVKTDLFDVILMDHMMPEMDGIETLHALKKMGDENLSRSAVVIALTANAIEGTKSFYISQGFDDYLSKPVDSRALEEMLWKYIPDNYLILDDKGTEEPKEAAKGGDMARYDRIIESLSGIIDTETGLNYCMNDREFYINTLERFADGDKQAVLVKEYEDCDNDNYRIHVHALKSSARLLGAQPLSDQALAIEEAMARGDNKFVAANHPLLMSEYTRVRVSVENALRENPEENDTDAAPIDPEEFKLLLSEIRDGLDDFDMDAADTASKKLSASMIPEEYAEDVKKLSKLIADVDLDNALTLANEILDRLS